MNHGLLVGLAVPAGLVAILAMARLARVRPIFRPLVGPFALATGAVLGLLLFGGGRFPDSGWLALVFLVPFLILVVRGTVIAFQALFRRRQGAAPPALLDSVVSVMAYAIGLGAIAHNWFGLELTPFLATSAVVGAVVGLALQDTLGNLFAGIALHTEAPFRVGDWVRVGDRDGRVDQVSWRAMRLQTWDGDTLTVPNNEVARHAILNYSVPRVPHSRVVILGVNYHTPPNKVISVLAGLLEQVPGVQSEPPPRVRIVGYHDFSIQYEVRYFFDAYDEFLRIEGEIHRLVWYHFKRHGIEIPFPVRNVFLHQVEAPEAHKEAPATRLERALRQIDLFRPLSDEELRTAAARCRPLHYAAGERIIEEGARGDSFFIVDRGEVEVSKQMDGARRTLARLMEGQFFGEMALLTGEDRAATVVAVTDVDLFTLDKAGFQDIIVGNPAIAMDISTILAERREALIQALGELGTRLAPTSSRGEMTRERILDRIRGYFGL
jgi:small-conductance mechanosensitive channel/CRP-like cAMP-binding protein